MCGPPCTASEASTRSVVREIYSDTFDNLSTLACGAVLASSWIARVDKTAVFLAIVEGIVTKVKVLGFRSRK